MWDHSNGWFIATLASAWDLPGSRDGDWFSVVLCTFWKLGWDSWSCLNLSFQRAAAQALAYICGLQFQWQLIFQSYPGPLHSVRSAAAPAVALLLLSGRREAALCHQLQGDSCQASGWRKCLWAIRCWWASCSVLAGAIQEGSAHLVYLLPLGVAQKMLGQIVFSLMPFLVSTYISPFIGCSSSAKVK